MKQISAFITIFTMFTIVLIPAIGLWWLTTWLDIAWVFWGAIGLSMLIVALGSL
mgnify:CR=1 FL=1